MIMTRDTSHNHDGKRYKDTALSKDNRTKIENVAKALLNSSVKDGQQTGDDNSW